MVLDSTRPRGATESPDKVLRSPARWAILALTVLLAVGGLALAVAGVAAPLGDGESRSGWPVVIGLELAVLGAAGFLVISVASPRSPLPPARPAAGAAGAGIELPVRPAHRVARLTALAMIAVLGVTMAFTGQPVGMILGGLMVLVGAVFLYYAARESTAIQLDPSGVLLPNGPTKNEHVAWRDVHEVAVTGGWRPTLVMTWRGPGLSASHIAAQAWPPSALVEVIDFYRTHKAERAELRDPVALERFRS